MDNFINKNKKRYESLDFIKAICAIMVIILHVPIRGNIGLEISVLSRTAVPIFFLISGFLFSIKNSKGINMNNDIKRQLNNIVRISLVSFLVYFFFEFNKKDILSFLNLKNILKLIIFNEPSVGGHLWYLFAYIYILIIFLLVQKYKKENIMYIFSLIGIVLYLIFGKYSRIIFNKEFNYLIVRNFLLMGFPYFSIGYLIGNSNFNKVKNKYICPMIVFFILFTIIENLILNYYNVNTKFNNYLGNTFIAISVFIFIINNNNLGKGTLINKIGKKYSLYIYIFHPLVNEYISNIILLLKINWLYDIYSYVGWLIVLVLTIFISNIVLNIKYLLKGTWDKCKYI